MGSALSQFFALLDLQWTLLEHHSSPLATQAQQTLSRVILRRIELHSFDSLEFRKILLAALISPLIAEGQDGRKVRYRAPSLLHDDLEHDLCH